MLSSSISKRCFYKSQSFIRQLATDVAAGSESVSVSSMSRPVVERGTGISLQQRAALRAARKERAAKFLESQGVEGAKSTSKGVPMIGSRMVWYLGLGVPTAIITWGCVDSSSPPATLSRYIGLTDFIRSYTDEIAKPAHEKLLPDWSQIPNVPHDIPVPHTLVLDLERTLVSSTWDRKYGWRHAKRPGVDKFLHDMAQYYEIVLYSPSIDGVAEPVVASLDKDGCIMHRLYRDATYYINGVHVKDLNRLNRNVKRMIVLDDDPLENQLNPENLIRVKPYNDPTDRTDNTLERITPFLIEIAREGYNDIPSLLRQYQGMDADQIADEQELRIQNIRLDRQKRSQQGLGRLAPKSNILPEPELPASHDFSYSATGNRTQQLTAKDIAGAAPPSSESNEGLVGWMNRRAKEKEELQMRKLEKWNEVMMKKQLEKRQQQEQ